VLEFLSQYGLFLAKSVTVVLAILIVVIGIISATSKARRPDKGHIEVQKLNDRFEDMKEALLMAVLDEHELKQRHKAEKKRLKKEQSEKKKAAKKEPY